MATLDRLVRVHCVGFMVSYGIKSENIKEMVTRKQDHKKTSNLKSKTTTKNNQRSETTRVGDYEAAEHRSSCNPSN